ncbi:GNAT family N-acetyltransferase [Pelagicoccus sp. NFK12]|uniref:GNAT family N-acetyltransferase n=1 Tax=Pelagicoccus enzymogenes TaxID=2773457 RepID=A0A927FDM6_9BACT|nr:GNAT family N-acetyltransferase [Pelagicoccus enzymogenes]MBD5781473.1 GNAT family N-acetyltransferase [Pelagicoccus enzymogenes]MDQ8199072.1 GNAT family N-acetyltransferase [Pelagicoccus enzymogenes]
MTHARPTETLPPSIIETERLILRTPRLEDAFALHELAAADPFFAHATVGPANSTLEAACTAIIRMLEDRRSGTGSWWIVIHKDTGHAIGITGFSARHSGHGPINALASSELGRGYAQEIVGALLNITAPLPSHQHSFETEPTHAEEPAPPTRWYWQSKPSRPARPGKLRCA